MDVRSIHVLYIAISIFFGSTVSLAQSFISPIISGLSPKDVLGNGAELGFGIGLKYQRKLGSQLEAFAVIEYHSFGQKTTNSIATTKITMLPIQLGVIWFIDPKKRYYFSGQAGVHYLTADASLNGVKVNISDESKFSYSPGIGMRLRQFDFGYRMQWIGTTQTLRYSVVYVSYQILLRSK